MPIVSVNIACYNSAAHIRETIDSVLGQTFKDFEIIIIDDGSTDDTGKIIASYKDSRIRYLYQKNSGLSNARNKAIELSRGEYIAFLDHDDIWVASKLEKDVVALKSSDDIALVYSNFFWLFPDRRTKLVLKGAQPSGYAFEGLLYNYTIGLITAVVRKKTIDALKLSFDPDFALCEDYDFFMRLAYKAKIAYINEPLSFYRIHNNMQSIRFGDKYPEEISSVIDNLERDHPDIRAKYGSLIDRMAGKVRFMRAKLKTLDGKPREARKMLKKCKWFGAKFAILYFLTYVPSFILLGIVRFRRKHILHMDKK
jgi:glycosyltransferase involved in cell wall biosynthesis